MSINNFYKYLTIESACAVLSNGSLKWSHPTEFNDPYDCSIDLKFDTDIDGDAKASLVAIKASSELLNHPSMRKLKLESLKKGTNFDKHVLKSIKKTIEKRLIPFLPALPPTVEQTPSKQRSSRSEQRHSGQYFT